MKKIYSTDFALRLQNIYSVFWARFQTKHRLGQAHTVKNKYELDSQCISVPQYTVSIINMGHKFYTMLMPQASNIMILLLVPSNPNATNYNFKWT